MKSALILLLFAALAQGCMALNDTQHIHPDAGFSDVAPIAAPPTTILAAPPAEPGGLARRVQPVMGGAPTMAVPLGGNLFQPESGGAPIVAIPTDL